MAPPSLFEKDENDRLYIADEISAAEELLTSHATEPLLKTQVERAVVQLEDSLQSLSANQNSIRHHAPKNTDMSVYFSEFCSLQKKGTRLLANFHGIYSTFPKESSATPPPSSSQSQQRIKLPPLELPKFSGNLQEWVSFRDIFKTAIDSSSLSKVEKLTQLKALLTGEAARQVRSLVLSEANYDIAWKSLTDRYENNRELLFAIMKRLFSQPSLTSPSATHLRSMIDTTKECVRQLDVLLIPTEHWDAVLTFLLFSKLDSSTREQWEQSLPDTSIPSLDKLYDFLEQRARALAAANAPPPPPRPMYRTEPPRVRSNHLTPSICGLCDEPHAVYRCINFQRSTVQVRNQTAKRLKLCLNCLSPGHHTPTCTSPQKCKVCHQRHHTMLHADNDFSRHQRSSNPPPNGNPAPTRPPPQSSSGNSGSQQPPSNNRDPTVPSYHTQPIGNIRTGILATAKVNVITTAGRFSLRSMLDPGTTNTSITEDMVAALNLPVRRCNIPLTGLEETTVGIAKHITTFKFSPHFTSDISYDVTALVVRSIGANIPSERLHEQRWVHTHGLQLADPTFHTPAKVNILFGADIFWQTLGQEKITGEPGEPFAIQSSLGWLIAGENNSSTPVRVYHLNASLDTAVQRFWEQETVDEGITQLTTEEQQCEDHFRTTVSRDTSGRFTVELPFKTPMPNLGDSRSLARTRFLSMESKFNSPKTTDPERIRKLSLQWEEYKKFMNEYELLGHMQLIPTDKLNPQNAYYIPHHSVIKESSTTTKLRVVFDASAATSTGVSLNDCLLVGPRLQSNLSVIILRGRLHKIMFISDIQKMYRQIKVAEKHWDYQRIFWREHPSLPLREYWLTTVTYGTTSAPHHAVRCLQELAEQEKHHYPEAARIATTDFYVDDNASGTDTIEDAKRIVTQLIDLTRAGGFDLRKWTTNCHELREFIPEELREASSLVELDTDNTVKTLGLVWNTTSDTYHFNLKLPPLGSGKLTKRKILSDIAKIFDPLGWLAPVIIRCKIFMQELWSLKLGWDDPVSNQIQEKWIQLRLSLSDIEKITIPRCINPFGSSNLILVGACDASIKAISACTYLMDINSRQCYLLESKTRVAPIKHVTLPRLELNSAVLLSELIKAEVIALNRPFKDIRCFTDSMISLAWISSSPLRWDSYVKRRVQQIQDNVPAAKWFHIPGVINPADCASRGVSAEELVNHPLWWSGSHHFYTTARSPTNLLQEEVEAINKEMRPVTSHHVSMQQPLHPIFTKYSSFQKLVRVLAYVIRFIGNWNNRRFGRELNVNLLSVRECQVSHNLIMRHIQFNTFAKEIITLSKNEKLPASSRLLSLQPFLDNGILRVGGRLRNANITFDRRHPILLPKHTHITNSIIMETHLTTLHSGPTATLASVQQQYWIVNGKDSVRYILKKCVVCTRQRATTMTQIMGDLPTDRVNPSRPFSKVGIDYAGPFLIKPMVRSKVTLKCWMSIFVCFSTRALHLELVSSLSTDCFLAALKRFTSRRGVPTDIFSDCGTNFKGAERVLNDLCLLSKDPAVQEASTRQSITWHFNPAGGPHFGGLWEAGVKSVKYHLHRVIGLTRLTYEEFCTFMVQIEGVLNSRPLVPASTDPTDLGVLTPAHFLVGQELTAIPEEDLTTMNEGHLQRWQKIQQLQQQFWRRWSNEFLSRLQQRPKWLKEQVSIAVDHLVLIKEENIPPLRWKLGRVIAIHPGKDGHVRVVTLRTATGELKRPIVKLSLLPISN